MNITRYGNREKREQRGYNNGQRIINTLIIMDFHIQVEYIFGKDI